VRGAKGGGGGARRSSEEGGEEEEVLGGRGRRGSRGRGRGVSQGPCRSIPTPTPCGPVLTALCDPIGFAIRRGFPPGPQFPGAQLHRRWGRKIALEDETIYQESQSKSKPAGVALDCMEEELVRDVKGVGAKLRVALRGGCHLRAALGALLCCSATGWCAASQISRNTSSRVAVLQRPAVLTRS
jgi:hypothetical protein